MEYKRPMNELRPKLFDVMKGYTKEQLIKDILSGIIVAIIALPLSIALAIASGVGPVQGLYTAIVAGFFISFFGGSRVQIGGPTAAFVVIIYGIVTTYGTDGLIVATIMAGIILCIMGLCHFGSLIKYIPYTITTGFTCGIAVTLFIGQIKDFLGLDMGAVPSEFIEKLGAYAANITTINPVTVAIGAVALVILILWPKVTDKLPGSLIAIIVTTAIVYFAKLPVNTIGSVYGELSSEFPSFHMPAFSYKLVQELINEEVCFLQQYGIHFAMDDYGTGNASSSIVLGVPMNEIKIDMSFIKGILNNEKQQMLVKNIVNFARSTNMKSCIEGVEDKSLQDYLRSFGATWFQGYYYSKPVGEEQLKKLLLEEMYNKKDAS